jgi:hypothetical protein
MLNDATTAAKYRHLIDMKVTGPLIDPLTGPGGDITGHVATVDAVTRARVHVTFRSGYRVGIPLDVAQGAYVPRISRATADVTLPTGSTLPLNKRQVADLIKIVADACRQMDDVLADGFHGGNQALGVDVRFPDGVTDRLSYNLAQVHLAALRATFAYLASVDADRLRQARADYFNA